jgi:hypothetical protein
MMFRDMIKSACGVCCAAVMMCASGVRGMSEYKSANAISNGSERLLNTFLYLTGDFPCRVTSDPLHIPNWKEEFMFAKEHLLVIRDCSDTDIYEHMRKAAIAVFGFRTRIHGIRVFV